MLNQIFSPTGRIGSAEFMRLAIIFIGIRFLADVISIYSTSGVIIGLLNLLGLVIAYVWVVLWIKRYHDAGKEGTFSLIPIAIYLLVMVTVTMIIVWPNMLAIMEANEAASTQENINALKAEMRRSKGLILAVINAGVAYAIAYLLNKKIGHDPNENKFGPAT